MPDSTKTSEGRFPSPAEQRPECRVCGCIDALHKYGECVGDWGKCPCKGFAS